MKLESGFVLWTLFQISLCSFMSECLTTESQLRREHSEIGKKKEKQVTDYVSQSQTLNRFSRLVLLHCSSGSLMAPLPGKEGELKKINMAVQPLSWSSFLNSLIVEYCHSHIHLSFSIDCYDNP